MYVQFQADLYGPKYVGAIHGRFLLAANLSAILLFFPVTFETF